MKKLLLDPLFRRFLSATVFAAAFVWVAVTYFNVDTEVVRVFLLMSFIFVGVMIAVGLILTPVMLLTRKKRSTLLDSSQPEKRSGSADKEQTQAPTSK